VAGVDLVVGREGEQLLADRFHEQVIIAGGQVAAADALVEQDIPGDHELAGMADEANAAFGMPGRVDHFQLRVSKPDDIPFLQQNLRVHRFQFFETVDKPGFFCMAKQFDAAFMGFEIKLVFAADEGRPGDMVDMAVGVDELYRFKSVRTYEAGEFILFGLAVTAGIDNGTFFGFIPEYKRVYLERVEGKALYVEHSQFLNNKGQRYWKFEIGNWKLGITVKQLNN